MAALQQPAQNPSSDELISVKQAQEEERDADIEEEKNEFFNFDEIGKVDPEGWGGDNGAAGEVQA